MEKNKKDMIYSLFVGIIVLGLSIICWLKPADDFSKTERRPLEQFPNVSVKDMMDGEFMTDFESYTLDQFPFRDWFRSIKAKTQKYILGQKDNNGIYIVGGYISKMDKVLSETALERSVKKLNSIYKTYIERSDAKVYISIIPDKNYFLAERNGYLAYDYEELYQYMKDGLSQMNYIEIRDLLSVEDYYRTDSHWKQECILDVAERLKQKMLSEEALIDTLSVTQDNSEQTIYMHNTLDTPFYGVYYGQAALSVEPDSLAYMNNDILSQCIVYDHENRREIPMYDLNLATGRDGYEMFLSGSLSVITIENPNAVSEKELVVFRDSFGSSMAPLLAESYAKTTILDIRYLNEGMIGEFVEFTNQDVLFLYSTSVLNNESSFR